jgi:tRNA(fMet)-specific endonuclease VapC
MKHLLDTNICIYLIRKKPPQALEKLGECSVGEVAISSITLAELQFGVHKSKHSAQNQRALAQFVVPLTIAAFDSKAAAAYGRIRAHLESQGTPIGPLDTLIAAHALSLNTTLVTNNVQEFSRVPDLRLVNWVSD